MKREILIIESDARLAQNISKRLEKSGYQVAGIRDNASDSFEFLKQHPNIDLVLLEIALNGEENGIDLAKKIRENFDLPIVYNTRLSDDDSFNKAFETHPDGYVVKTSSMKNLNATLKFTFKKFTEKSPERPIGNIRIPVRDKGCLVLLDPKQIILAKADGLYTKITTTNKPYMVRGILKNYEDKLSKYGFIRVHKSYLVNINFIQSFNSKKLLIQNEYIPIKRGLYNTLKEILHNK